VMEHVTDTEVAGEILGKLNAGEIHGATGYRAGWPPGAAGATNWLTEEIYINRVTDNFESVFAYESGDLALVVTHEQGHLRQVSDVPQEVRTKPVRIGSHARTSQGLAHAFRLYAGEPCVIAFNSRSSIVSL
jgi:hypothetical protein